MKSLMARIDAEVQAGRFREAAALIEQGLAQDAASLLPNRIALAHWLTLAANWEMISRLLPAGANFFLESGWLESLLRARPVDKLGEPIPWYTYPAIEFLEPRLRADFRVFEYGSGWSTLWWSRRVAAVCTVEHDAGWLSQIQPKLASNVRASLRTEAGAYVGEIAACGGNFDVIVVDGEHRELCARAAAQHLKPDGVIVFDNSDRAAYSEGVRFLSDSGWLRADFFGLTPAYAYKNCTSLFFRDTRWLSGAPLPAQQLTSIGRSCSQAMGA